MEVFRVLMFVAAWLLKRIPYVAAPALIALIAADVRSPAAGGQSRGHTRDSAILFAAVGDVPEDQVDAVLALSHLNVRVKKDVVCSRGDVRIVEVWMTSSGITDDHVVYLSGLPFLNSLILTNASVTEKGTQHIASLSQLRQIHLPKGINDAALAHVGKMRHLERLRLLEANVTDEGLAVLGELESLRTLSIKKTPISGKALQHVAKLEGIEELVLCNTRVDDDGVLHLKSLKHLARLNLEGTDVSDDAMRVIVEMENLESLGLKGTRITDAGLAKLHGLPKLRHLTISDTRVSESAVNELRKALPDISVYGHVRKN